jgi:hypothetical protein
MKYFDRVFDWLETRPLYQIVVGVVLAFVILMLLVGCGPYPVDCRTDTSIQRAKDIEVLVEKPGGRVEPWDYQWARGVRASYPQCWNEVER